VRVLFEHLLDASIERNLVEAHHISDGDGNRARPTHPAVNENSAFFPIYGLANKICGVHNQLFRDLEVHRVVHSQALVLQLVSE